MARARLAPIRREEMALSVMVSRVSKVSAARVYGVSAKIVSRWTARFIAQGRDGMQGRSSRPGHSLNQTDQVLVAVVTAQRRQRLCGGPIALPIGLPPATISQVLRVGALADGPLGGAQKRSVKRGLTGGGDWVGLPKMDLVGCP